MTPDSRRTARATAAVALVALALLGGVALTAGRDPVHGVWVSDALSYHLWAERLVEHGLAGEPPFHQAPLWPALLALAYAAAGAAPGTVLALQVLLTAAAVACLVPLGAVAFDSRRAGVAAAGLTLLHGPLVLHATMPVPVPLAALTQVGGLLALTVARRRPGAGTAVGTGLAWGLAAIARPEMLAMIPVAAVAVARPTRPDAGRPATRLGLAAAAAALLVVAPVTIHNLRAGGGPVPVASSAGENLFAGNRLDGGGGHMPIDPSAGDLFTQRRRAAEIARAETGRELSPAGVSAYWTRRALREVASDPAAWLALEGRKLGRLLSPGDPADLRSFPLALETDPLRFGVFLVPPVALLGLGVAGAWLAWRRRRRLVWPLLALVALHVAVLLAFFVSTRLRLPLLVALAPFAGHAVDRGLAAWRAGTGRAPLAVAAGLLLAATVATPFVTTPPAGERLRLAATLSIADRPDAALAALAPLLAASPPDPLALEQAGWIHQKRGEWDAAAGLYGRALETGLPPGREPGARFRHAQVLERAGRPDEALAQLDRLVASGAANGQAYLLRGRLLARAGRRDEARRDLTTALRLDPGLDAARRELEGLD